MNYYLHSVDPAINRYRYYAVVLEKSLFGEYILTRSWGRIGQKGQVKITPLASYDEALGEIQRILQIRKLHGYVEV